VPLRITIATCGLLLMAFFAGSGSRAGAQQLVPTPVIPPLPVPTPALPVPVPTVPAVPPVTAPAVPTVTAPAAPTVLPAPTIAGKPTAGATPAAPTPASPKAPRSGSKSKPATGRRKTTARPTLSPPNRRLRNTVSRLSACLGALPLAERRVLELRAALDRDTVSTRAAVARRLDIGVRRVARLERSGLRHLRERAGGGSCRAGGALPVAAVAGPPAPASADRDAGRPARGAVKDAAEQRALPSRTPTPTPGGDRGSTADRRPSRPAGALGIGPGRAGDPVVILFLAAVVGLIALIVYVIAREVARRRPWRRRGALHR
jgi:hypothetical protein